MCALCQLPTTHQSEMVLVSGYLRYIDPGSGYVLGPIIPAIFTFLGGLLLSAGLFFKRSFFFFNRKKSLILATILAILVLGYFGFKYMSKIKQESGKKIIVLAIDGLDPKIIEEGIQQGLLPNIKKLKGEGYFSELQTTIPPQSPVAWASFITGEAPQKHKIYDFITRDPANYNLNVSYSDSTKFKWLAEPFWKKTTQKNIPIVSLFLPDTYLDQSNINGKMIAGMGVPDLLGTQGSLTLFTTHDYSEKKDFRGKIVSIKNQDSQTVSIPGPKYKDFKDVKTAEIPLTIEKAKTGVKLTVQNQTIPLKSHEFSDWVTLKFDAGLFNKVEGIAKFYLKSAGSEFEIYLSPINFNPQKPLKQISSPASYAKDLAKEYGLFYTQGLPIDSWAFEQDIMDEKAFLAHIDSILTEREKIYFGELQKFHNGIFIGYFGIVDSVAHMFWRYRGQQGPYEKTILSYYQKIDGIIGQTMVQMDRNTSLIILSDHGFDSFDYEVNVNSWLYKEGYIVLKPGITSTTELFDGIDWTKTRAFSAGYNGIFINLKGREKGGIVDASSDDSLVAELSQKLLKSQNPFTNRPLVKHVYTAHDLKTDKNDLSSPDLFIGFYKGARASWDSAVGIVNEEVVRERKSKWSGDHLFDPTEVPGVLISNKQLSLKKPGITQVMPYILEMFNK